MTIDAPNIVLIGPPGVGKSTVGAALASQLNRRFVDIDTEIEAAAGQPLAEIFTQHGEAAFREHENAAILRISQRSGQVIAPGGGALLNPENQAAMFATGTLVSLQAQPATLLTRLQTTAIRPLLAGKNPAANLQRLLTARADLYGRLFDPIPTDECSVAEVVAAVAAQCQPRELILPPSRILLGQGSRFALPQCITTPAVLVTDENLVPWADPLANRLNIPLVVLSAGEQHKTLASVQILYDAFLTHGLNRHGTVIALGGGVVGDLVGFAAATFMRGVRWINLPTSLLAMVDASLGGKTGVDLPQGKNLAGAFHPPSAVLTDPDFLFSLPPTEKIAGLAEVLKHGIIADPDLFHTAGPTTLTRELLARAIQVKIDIVTRDPYEKGERAALNLGHTLGHAIEAASDYHLRHGEAVAIGLVGEAHLAVALGLAEPDLPSTIATRLQAVGLPTTFTGLPLEQVRQYLHHDKKNQNGRPRFALPQRLGKIAIGVIASDDQITHALQQIKSEAL